MFFFQTNAVALFIIVCKLNINDTLKTFVVECFAKKGDLSYVNIIHILTPQTVSIYLHSKKENLFFASLFTSLWTRFAIKYINMECAESVSHVT